MSCAWLLFAYFHNELQTLNYAVSSDGLQWTPLNAGYAVMNTTPTLRDPFVNRLPEGGYRMVTTNGDRNVNILSFFSVDLITWSPVQELNLMSPPYFNPPAAIGDLWAPEWRYDAVQEDYVLFWAARGTAILPSLPSPNCTGIQDSRFAFFYSRTTDWKTFSQPQIMFDPGCFATGDGGIDGDIVQDDDGKYVLVYKDARGVGEGHAAEVNRGIRLAYSDTLAGPYNYANATVSNLLVPTLVEAPELYPAPDNGMAGWYLYYDCSFWPTPPGYPRPPYGVAHSPSLHAATANFTVIPGACTGNSTQVSFPKDATHGSFLCIDQQTYNILIQAFPPSPAPHVPTAP